MTVETNLFEVFISFGGAVFFMLIFVFALFGAEILYLATRRLANKSKHARKYFTDDGEGNCPL